MAKAGKRGRRSAGSPSSSLRSSKKDRQRFVRDVLARGEAARRDVRGRLPASATHVLVDTPKGPAIRRHKFKLS
jgi:hypothetical protein